MSCVIFFNCHGNEIKKQLLGSTIFNQKYEIVCIPLYDYLEGYKYQNEKTLIFQHIEIISNADILIVQYIKKDRGFLNYDEIKKYSKNECMVIKIPHYTFSGYFSAYDVIHDVNFDISKSYQELVVYLDNLDCHTEKFIKLNLESELENIKKLDDCSDIKMYEFTKNNYNSSRLFHSRSYPTYIFFHFMSSEILKICNISEKTIPKYSMSFITNETPIYDKIINILDLQFPWKSNKCYNYNIIEYFVSCKTFGANTLILDMRGKHKRHISVLNSVMLSKKYNI
jgi:hypothetical protein